MTQKDLERDVLKVLVGRWLQEKLSELFRETGKICKVIGIEAIDLKLVVIDVLIEVLKVAKKILEQEKTAIGGRKFWQASTETKKD